MKTYAPKGLRGEDLRDLMLDLHADAPTLAKFLRVTERTVWRWLADHSAPFAVLAALWHETPHGRHVTALDVGNELVIVKGLARSLGDQSAAHHAQLCRVLAISDTGAANDPLLIGPDQFRAYSAAPAAAMMPHGIEFDPAACPVSGLAGLNRLDSWLAGF